jgi:GAF domain-containing protein
VPVPLPDTLAWGEYLLPAGYRNGVAVGLCADDGRHLGFITRLSDDPSSLTAEHRDVLGELRPLVARALDRLPSLAALGRLTGDALGADQGTDWGSTRSRRRSSAPRGQALTCRPPVAVSPSAAVQRRPGAPAGT